MRNRRQRLINFLDHLDDGSRRYDIRIGFSRAPWSVLNDDALESLAQQARRDFWFDRVRTRDNRAARQRQYLQAAE